MTVWPPAGTNGERLLQCACGFGMTATIPRPSLAARTSVITAQLNSVFYAAQATERSAGRANRHRYDLRTDQKRARRCRRDDPAATAST